MRLKVALFCGVVAVSAYAKADWQYTTWGMTPSELEVAATRVKVELWENLNEESFKSGHILRARYSTSKYDFIGTFYFPPRDQKLQGVSLLLQNRLKCKELVSDLKVLYGEPKQTKTDKDFSKILWDVEAKNNQISVFADSELRAYCVLTYKSLTHSKANPEGTEGL
jgi:hypothetical protein